MASPVVGGVITTVCVDASDAQELQFKLNAELQGFRTRGYVVDCTLSGVGSGPRWLAQLTFTDTRGDFSFSLAQFTAAICMSAGNPVELNAKIQAAALVGDYDDYIALETAGASDGRDYMAVLLRVIPD